MKVLFLDIDGVLNSSRTLVAFGGYPLQLDEMGAFDRVAIHLIQALCRGSRCSVVLSSAWRLHCDWNDVANAFGLPIMGCTPSLPGNRGSEIARWLSEHPEVDQYAIVDDDADMLDGQLPHFVKTNGHEGLSWTNYIDLCRILGADPHDGSPRDRNWSDPGKFLQWEVC